MYRALLVTPIPPHETGLATYALRILDNTLDICEWTVAYPEGGDPDCLPEGVIGIPLGDLMNLPEEDIPKRRIFQLGNSIHCFPILRALYRLHGVTIFHETVLHHMLRYCYHEEDMLDEYRRELRFSYGPGASGVEDLLSQNSGNEYEYDLKLKKYPLIGRAVHASDYIVTLNEYAAERLITPDSTREVLIIGHPLSSIETITEPEKPFEICIGMAGGYNPGRNLDAFLEAVGIIHQARPEVGAVLIGGGYPNNTPEWVIKTGRLPEENYQGWIRILDIAVDARFPTCGETSGSLLEVLRAGIPSITVNSGAFRNIPCNAVLHISPNDISSGIKNGIEQILSSDEMKKTLSVKAVEYAESTGSKERLRSDWKAILRYSVPCVQTDGGASISISPAWNDPPDGFTRILSGNAVRWMFNGPVRINGPESCTEAWITACGEGEVNGLPLTEEFCVMEVVGNSLAFSGNGMVTDVLWK